MIDIPTRTIAELITRYELEPSISEIFTEGDTDTSLLRGVLLASGIEERQIDIYTIDTVEVPRQVVNNYRVGGGNRSEVIALCGELESHFGQHFMQVTGVIDADGCSLIGEDNLPALVVTTDYCCMEMYFFEESLLRKLLLFAFPKVTQTSAQILTNMGSVLKELFLARLANVSLKLELRKWEIKHVTPYKSGSFVFSRDTFLKDYLTRSYKIDLIDRFEGEIERLRAATDGDIRHYLNGHDFLGMLSLLLASYHSKLEDKERTRPSALFFSFCCCLDVNELTAMPMFQSIIARISPIPCLERM